ncbi:MAG: hypothetical protein ACTSR8_17755 [Promethearchaeota archaeon]
MLSEVGFLEGSTALCVTAFSIIFGIFSSIQGRKKEAALLKVAGLMIFFIGLLWLGPTTDFLWIMISNKNIDNSWGLYGILSYMWVAPAITLAMYIGAELLAKEKQKMIIVLFVLLSIVFEFILFTSTMESFTFVEPEQPGTELIDSSHNMGYPTFYLIIIFLVSAAIFDGVGFLLKASKTSGVVRKKFLYLGLGFLVFVVCAAFDSLASPGIGLVFVRLGVITSIILLYNGLRT